MWVYLLLSILFGLYSLAVFLGGWWFGRLDRRGTLDETVDAAIARAKARPKPTPTESGPVKPMTPEEIEAEKLKPMRERMAEVLNIKKP